MNKTRKNGERKFLNIVSNYKTLLKKSLKNSYLIKENMFTNIYINPN